MASWLVIILALSLCAAQEYHSAKSKEVERRFLVDDIVKGYVSAALTSPECIHCERCLCMDPRLLAPSECDVSWYYDPIFVPRCSVDCKKDYRTCLPQTTRNHPGYNQLGSGQGYNQYGQQTTQAHMKTNYPVFTPTYPPGPTAAPNVPITTASVTGNQVTTNSATPITNKLTLKQCDKYRTIDFIGRHIYANDSACGSCADGAYHTPQALVTQACAAPPPTVWKQHLHVMSNCTAIPQYSPIGTFFMETSLLSGVLLNCQTDGFKMVLQTCTALPQIVTATTQTKGFNVNDFYAISWV